jgi:hypothetical protein
MNKLIKKLFGIDKIEAQAERSLAIAVEATEAAKKATEAAERAKAAEEEAKATPKDRATKKGEAWVSVMDTKVNVDNPRNGFFELDWNEQFIVQLKLAGYGFDGDPEEEIVDRWFRDLARNMLAEEGLDAGRSAGYINVTKLQDGKSQIE